MTPLPLSSAIPAYLDALRLAKKSDNTIRTYKHALRRFSGIVGEGAPLTEETLIKFLQTVGKETDRAQLTYRVPVGKLYKQYAPGIPADLIIEQYGQKKVKRLKRYNEQDVERLISFAWEKLRGDLSEYRDRAYIVTAADTGIRISEACSLIRKDIDFDRARAVIIGKGDKAGVIRFSPRSLEAIRDYWRVRAELDGKTGRPLFSLPVFARHDRGAGSKIKPVGAHGLWASFEIRKRQAGITEEDEAERGEVTPHKLRDRFVTMIYRDPRGGIERARILARHESIETTKGYGHLAESELDDTYREIFG